MTGRMNKVQCSTIQWNAHQYFFLTDLWDGMASVPFNKFLNYLIGCRVLR